MASTKIQHKCVRNQKVSSLSSFDDRALQDDADCPICQALSCDLEDMEDEARWEREQSEELSRLLSLFDKG